MAKTRVLQDAPRDGTTNSSSVRVGATAGSVFAEGVLGSVDLADTSNRITIVVEQSYDNGQTWSLLGGSTWVGGSLDRFGNPVGPTVGPGIPSNPRPDRVRVRVDHAKRQNIAVDIEEFE